MDTSEGTHAYELSAQPANNLSQRVMTDLFAVAKGETQLALIKARDGAKGGRRLVLSTLFAFAALLSLGSMARQLLSGFMKGWMAAGVVAAAFALPAAMLRRSGRAALAEIEGTWFDPAASVDEAAGRAEAARESLQRDVTALSQRGKSSPSPVRDAILSDVAVTLGTVIQAGRSAR